MEKTKEMIMKHKKWLIGIVMIFVVWLFFFRTSDALTQNQFEEKLKEYSNGKVVLADAKVSPISGGTGMYTAKWNGMMITAKVDKDGKMILPYSITTPPAGYMNEISLGQYRELIQCLTKIADPSLSVDDMQHLVDNDLNFNNQIMTAQKYSTSKNNLKYELYGGEKETTWFWFMITENKK